MAGRFLSGTALSGSTGGGQARFGQASGRLVILATVLGSGMALLDTTAVNVALPTIGRELRTSLGGLQWIVTGYALALAALILIGGSLGDRFGRRKIFMIGVAWFALTSALCGLAPDIGVLIAARVLQGAGGALLVPGSLAIIQASFTANDRARAIGAWSGLGGLASAAGPLLGGWLVVTAGWRWVFLLNLPVAAVVLSVAARGVPESRNDGAGRKFDVLGACLAALALAGVSYALIGGSGLAWLAGLIGAACGAAFIAVERRRGIQAAGPAPMLPLSIFWSWRSRADKRRRQFTVINVITFCMYAALSGEIFMLVLQLQVSAGFSALAAGACLLPVTAAMLLLSPSAAALAQRIGPRGPVTVGCLTCAGGLLLALRIGPGASYLADVLPAVVVFGLGLCLVVAPLTATVLASAEVRHAGLASGVNNAVARAAGLLAVAGLPAAVGLRAAGYRSAVLLTSGFRASMLICAGLLVLAASLAVALIDDDVLRAAATPGDRQANASDAVRSGA